MCVVAKFNAINISHLESNGGGKGTIEFRQHQGTLNNLKLKNFVFLDCDSCRLFTP